MGKTNWWFTSIGMEACESISRRATRSKFAYPSSAVSSKQFSTTRPMDYTHLAMKFKNAPLIELVAEFRWIPNTGAVAAAVQQGAGNLAPMPIADTVPSEAFFSKFSTGIARHGYAWAERLIPMGWPFPNFMPVFRFRHPDIQGKNEPTLFQIGSGIFSAHALPPYETWEQFKPVIEKGLEVLLSSRSVEEQPRPFNSITLRYIDRFTGKFTGTLSSREFIEQVLNVRLQLPSVLIGETNDEAKINPSMLLRIPLKSGLLMNLNINAGVNVAAEGFLMDTIVTTNSATDASVDSAMKVLGQAHDSIRRVFVGLTTPISDKLEPEQNNVTV